MIHSTVPPGMVGGACHFRTIDEYWYVLSGEGEIWRRAPDGHESITLLIPGVCVDIRSARPFSTAAPGRTSCLHLHGPAAVAWRRRGRDRGRALGTPCGPEARGPALGLAFGLTGRPRLLKGHSRTLAQARRSLLRALASGPLSQPIIAGKRVNRHRLARAPVASARTRIRAWLHAAGCFVSPVRDVRRIVSTSVRLKKSSIAASIASVAMPSFRRSRSPTSPPRLRRGDALDAVAGERSSAQPRKQLPCLSRTAHGPKPCSRHWTSAARVSRKASAAFLDARACRTRRGLSAGEASAVPFEDWFLPGQAPAGRSRSAHPRAEYDRPVRVTFPNTGPMSVPHA